MKFMTHYLLSLLIIPLLVPPKVVRFVNGLSYRFSSNLSVYVNGTKRSKTVLIVTCFRSPGQVY